MTDHTVADVQHHGAAILDELEKAEMLAHEHMGKFKEGMTPRQLAYMLTGYYQSHQMMPTIKTLKPYLDEEEANYTRAREQYSDIDRLLSAIENYSVAVSTLSTTGISEELPNCSSGKRSKELKRSRE